MTLRQLIETIGQYWAVLVVAFAGLPIGTWAVGRLHGPGRGLLVPWRYVYAVLIYVVCVPGTASVLLCAYVLLFTRENLLDVNALVFFLPWLSMVASLLIMGRNVAFDDVPGFDRLSGLLLVIAITFLIVYGLSRTRLWLIFGSSVFTLLGLLVGLFSLLQWGAHAAFGKRVPAPPQSER